MERLRRLLLQENIPHEIDCPLSRHASFRIGGTSDLAVFPQSREQLLRVLCAVLETSVRYAVIGNASNVVFPDGAFHGVVIFTCGYKEITLSGSRIQASAGVSLLSLARTACDAALSGLEFAYGIPGTLGGAILMNAGAYGGEISSVCVESEFFDAESGKISSFAGDSQEFGYRTSIYEKHPRYTILGATLQLSPDDRDAVRLRMEDYIARRRSKQPLDFPSAGSVFKRPEGHFAGKLIEDCGLKGFSIGGAQVSEKHAGFIINRGGATAADVRALVEFIRERVFITFGIELVCEIKFI